MVTGRENGNEAMLATASGRTARCGTPKSERKAPPSKRGAVMWRWNPPAWQRSR